MIWCTAEGACCNFERTETASTPSTHAIVQNDAAPPTVHLPVEQAEADSEGEPYDSGEDTCQTTKS